MMRSMLRHLVFVVMVVETCSAGCNSSLPLTMPGNDLASPTGPSQYVFDFSGSPTKGIKVGNMVNLAVTFDHSQPVRRFILDPSDNLQMPGLVVSFDYGRCSGSGLIEVSKDRLPGTDTVWADYVDVEVLPPVVEETQPGVCHGYREPSGAWHWTFQTTRLTRDAATNLYRARLSIKKGPLDAVKLLMNTLDVQLSRVTVTSQAP